MNIMQAFKMALKSIRANHVCSFLTMLGIIISVAAAIIIELVAQDSNCRMKECYAYMGHHKINVMATLWNDVDATQSLYDYCLSLDDLALGHSGHQRTWAGDLYNHSSNNI